jgi:hypothetical protein
MWWGNYIPESSVINTVGAVFNLNELVANIENSRSRREVDWDNVDWDNWPDEYEGVDSILVYSNGSKFNLTDNPHSNMGPTTLPTGNIRWQEVKHSDIAVRGSRVINIDPALGFPYFIYPAEFNVIIRDALGEVNWARHPVVIDGKDYMVAHDSVKTSNPQGGFIWEFISN